MGRRKSTDTPEVKALRKLLLSLGLTVPAVNTLLVQMAGHLTDLSSKACEVEMYIAAHPEVKNPDAYAATTLRNYAAEHAARRASADMSPVVKQSASAPSTMELWGEEEL